MTLARLAVPAGVIVALLALWFTNDFLTQRFTQSTRNRAEVRLTLYSGNLYSELQRSSIVPQLLARDPALIGALNSGDYSQSTQRLISFLEEIGAASLSLLDRDGRVVAASDRTRLGGNLREAAYFVDARRASGTVFTQMRRDAGDFAFYYARRIEEGGQFLGVIVVEVDLARLETAWSRTMEGVIVTDSAGQIILATEPRWRGKHEADVLADQAARSRLERAFEAAQGWDAAEIDAYLSGRAVMRLSRRVSFQGWRIVSFTPYASVRERVNGVLAIEVMGFAIFLALMFFYLNRLATSKAQEAARESADLRALNQRLQREIAERRKVERTLEVAEQTIEQSSKLAALGEMSAAVSHELNQPLAAMKTYLAGARLLLERRRPEEASAAFQRIDDLIERMGGITRQLKSYARKGADGFAPLDVRDAVTSAISLMEPQLKAREVSITRSLPPAPVPVMGDRMRLEQVIINLLRNALDATKSEPDARIDILLTSGDMVRLTVRDNGHGIADPDALFEPFYTTKKAGDGIGLGLAISSGIVSDLGGRLTARHGAGQQGAVFEVELPCLDETTDMTAAE